MTLKLKTTDGQPYQPYPMTTTRCRNISRYCFHEISQRNIKKSSLHSEPTEDRKQERPIRNCALRQT